MIQKFVGGPLHTNCYLYADDISKEGVVIDPGAKADEIFKFAKSNNIDIKYIILTHGHFDHILEVSRLKNHTGAMILMSKGDVDFINDKSKNMCLEGFDIELFVPDKYLSDGDKIELGTTMFEVLETPGHTPGGISLYANGVVFSGDTLFFKTVGRTDLYGGNDITLWDSINEKLFTLPDDTIVYSGHARQTTIGSEKDYWK